MPIGAFRLNTLSRIIPSVSSVTYVNNYSRGVAGTGANTLTITNAIAGDLLVMVTGGGSGSTTAAAPADTTPSGWTQIATSATGTQTTSQRDSYFYKIATASGESVTGLSGTGGLGGSTMNIFVYRPNQSIFSVSVVGSPGAQTTTAAPTNQTLTLGQSSPPFILGFATWSSSGSSPTVGSTTTATRTSARTISVATYGYFYAYETVSSMSSSTISMTDNGTNSMGSFLLQLY